MPTINLRNEARQKLHLAEKRTRELFHAIETGKLIVAGKTELELAEQIVKLASDKFGIEKYWHKKIVRTGANTLVSYTGNPPDLVIQKSDILFIDFGPIVDGWEADFGRTYVLGNDPLKLKLKTDVELAWHEAKSWYDQQPQLTGAAFFQYARDLATRYGWEFTGDIAGHIVGPYPHEQLAPGDMGLDIHPDNDASIFLKDPDGNDRYWILELQFVDRARQIGAYFEQLI